MNKSNTADKIRGGLWGIFIGDAMAMPAHWYYDRMNLRKEYGMIQGYVAPKETIRGCIMKLSSTGGGGRGKQEGSIIGDVINHGKKEFWTDPKEYHYHVGLKAGENTLEASLTLLTMKVLNEVQGTLHDPDTTAAGNNAALLARYRSAYISFMTTPGSHNDVYAATAHRMFFKNWSKGTPPEKCPDNDRHNVDAIDALTYVLPLVLTRAAALPALPGEEDITKTTEFKAVETFIMDAVRVVRDVSPDMAHYIAGLCLTAYDIIVRGHDPRRAAQAGLRLVAQRKPSSARTIEGVIGAALESINSDDAGLDPMAACYIDTSFPAMAWFLIRYNTGFEDALYANTNAGGENVARGALIGALIGAAIGERQINRPLIDGLCYREAIATQVDDMISVLGIE